ncbi:OmpA family protein [Vibrio gigantis]|uniref:OmpA family protein n=1 Tax=Vibrio TaxID=662 RepID=UPI00076A7DD3|nr:MULTISPECIES: OmpA family protein [Vibrio]MDL5027486.1 OmpA family protein [Vibrio sp. TMPB1044]MDN5207614.1 OmpA family protein [Vibrio sp. TMPB1044]MEC7309544.1 OmpA family protein [Vibrio crassostreae]
MRHFKLALLSSILLMGCAETPDTTMTRHQIDDLADNDRDGVINQRDLCADTPEGVAVDIKGCANWKIVEDVEVLSVAFDFDKYDLKPDHTAVLNELVRLLGEQPDASVTLVGDTSSEGTNVYNKALAKKRTGVIRDALIDRGVDGERIFEQEFTQITSLTQHLHKRKRRTIAVIKTESMEVNPSWNIFTSEMQLDSNSDVESKTSIDPVGGQ